MAKNDITDSLNLFVKILDHRKKLYRKILTILIGLIILHVMLKIIFKTPTFPFVIILIFLLLFTFIFIVLILQISRYENTLNKLILQYELDCLGRHKIDPVDLINGIAPDIGSDIAINTVACEMPGIGAQWCAADIAGNVVELAVCRANHNSKACKDAKAVVGGIEFAVDKFAKELSKALKKLDDAMHAKGYLAGDIGVMLGAGGVSSMLTMLGNGVAGLIGYGTTPAALSLGLVEEGSVLATGFFGAESGLLAAGPVGAAIAAAAGIGYGIYEACHKSKKCREAFGKLDKDVVKAYKGLKSVYKDVDIQFTDAWHDLKKGNIGGFFKHVGHAIAEMETWHKF